MGLKLWNMKKIESWKDVQNIYKGVDIEFCIGVLEYLRNNEEPDRFQPNMARQGYWRAKSDKLELTYQVI